MEKKRPPIEQLREAGKIARQMLVKRGIITEESVIDKILAEDNAPTLPGIPSYLPHRWTIKATQQIMRDIVILWRDECGDDLSKQENIHRFWLFAQKELYAQAKKFGKESKSMRKAMESMKEVPVLKDVFSPMRKKENAEALHRFIVDSFAVAIVVKHHDTTSDYLNWFLDWTQDLETLWIQPKRRKKFKRV